MFKRNNKVRCRDCVHLYLQRWYSKGHEMSMEAVCNKVRKQGFKFNPVEGYIDYQDMCQPEVENKNGRCKHFDKRKE